MHNHCNPHYTQHSWQFMNTLTRRRQPLLSLPTMFAIPWSTSATGGLENDLDDRTNSIYSRFSAAGIVDNARLLGVSMVVKHQTGNNLPIDLFTVQLFHLMVISRIFSWSLSSNKNKTRVWNWNKLGTVYFFEMFDGLNEFYITFVMSCLYHSVMGTIL